MNSASAAKDRYNKKKYDRILVIFPKGHKEILDNIAQQQKLTAGSLIRKIVNEYLEEHAPETKLGKLPQGDSDKELLSLSLDDDTAAQLQKLADVDYTLFTRLLRQILKDFSQQNAAAEDPDKKEL